MGGLFIYFLLHWYMMFRCNLDVLYTPIHCYEEILKQLSKQIIKFYVFKAWLKAHNYEHFPLHKNVVSSVIQFFKQKLQCPSAPDEQINFYEHLLNISCAFSKILFRFLMFLVHKRGWQAILYWKMFGKIFKGTDMSLMF